MIFPPLWARAGISTEVSSEQRLGCARESGGGGGEGWGARSAWGLMRKRKNLTEPWTGDVLLKKISRL